MLCENQNNKMMCRDRLAVAVRQSALKSSTKKQIAAAASASSSFLGVKFTKYFKKKAFEGRVVSYKRPFFLIKYCDGDTEEMTLKELGGACKQQHISTSTSASSAAAAAAAAEAVAAAAAATATAATAATNRNGCGAGKRNKKEEEAVKKRATVSSSSSSMEFSSQILSLEYEQRKRYYNDLIVAMLDEERIPFTETTSIVLLDDEALRSSRRFAVWMSSSSSSSSSKHVTTQKQITVVNRRQDVAFLAESAGFTGFVGDLAQYASPFQIAYCDFCSIFSTNRGLLERFLHLLDTRHVKCIFFASFSLRAVNRESCFREMRAFFTDPATVAPIWNQSRFELHVLSHVNMVFVTAVYTRVEMVGRAQGLSYVSESSSLPAFLRIDDGYGSSSSSSSSSPVFCRVKLVGMNTSLNTVHLIRDADKRHIHVPWERALQQTLLFRPFDGMELV